MITTATISRPHRVRLPCGRAMPPSLTGAGGSAGAGAGPPACRRAWGSGPGVALVDHGAPLWAAWAGWLLSRQATPGRARGSEASKSRAIAGASLELR